jgi:DNA-binding transcriptional regulator YiaG
MTSQEVRRLRRRQQWTQVEFARRLGVTPRTVGRWEQDTVTVPAGVVRLIKYVISDATIPRGGKR